MGPFYCVSLLALCGIGVLVQSHLPQKICENKLNSITKQRLTIQKLIIKQQSSVKWLETVCHMRLPKEFPELPGGSDQNTIPSSAPTHRPEYPTTNYPTESTPPPGWIPTDNGGANGVYPPTTPDWNPPTFTWPTTSRPTIPPTSENPTQWPEYPGIEWPTPPPVFDNRTERPIFPSSWPTVWPSRWPSSTTRRWPTWPTWPTYPPTYPPPPTTQPPTTPTTRRPTRPSTPSRYPTRYPPTPPSNIDGNNGNGQIIWGEWGGFKTNYEIELDALKTTLELIAKYGYPSETHYVTTYDSYILTLHRIPRPGAQPILLVHGLMSSSASWVQMGPSDGLAFLLYQQGFDVWMLNTRGNLYSKTHKRPNIKASEYWGFTFHEIGIYDLPNSIDLILSITKQPQLQYVGHSQGSTAFFVMCSELPHYNAKITLMQALSPTVYLQNSLSPVLRYLSLFKGEFSILLNLLGGFEISRDNTLITQFRNHICTANVLTSKICEIFDFVLAGFGWNQFNATLTPLVAGHASQGASTLQIYHYAQLINGLIFRRYDKGFLLNNIEYHSSEPPSYNLTNINCKVALHHSQDDWLSRSSDIEKLQYRLPNLLYSRQVSGFSHYDYLISKNVRSGLYNDVINECQRHRIVATFSVAWELHL